MPGGRPAYPGLRRPDRRLDELCAVKTLRSGFPANAVKLIQREARVGLTVRHPRLVRIDYAHVMRSPYFLVMELLPGESLRSRLRRQYRLDTGSALWIARQTAEALAALHRGRFVHGDLKPDNIRLVEDGTARLIDLGFAHRVEENAFLLEQGYVLGTVNYLAPESAPFDPASRCPERFVQPGRDTIRDVEWTPSLPARYDGPNHAPPPLRPTRRPPPTRPRLIRRVGHARRPLTSPPRRRPPIRRAVVQQLIALEIATLRRRRTA